MQSYSLTVGGAFLQAEIPGVKNLQNLTHNFLLFTSSFHRNGRKSKSICCNLAEGFCIHCGDYQTTPNTEYRDKRTGFGILPLLFTGEHQNSLIIRPTSCSFI